jgi:hypothetical protein
MTRQDASRDPLDLAADMPESVRAAFRALEWAMIDGRAACGGMYGDELEWLVLLAIRDWYSDQAADAMQDAG